MDENKEKKSLSKGVIIGIVLGVVLILSVIIVLLLKGNKKEEYRIVKVYEIDGKTLVTREGKGELEAYQNMVLTSGDDVYVEAGTTTLKLDEDKYVYAEEQTQFTLIATGTKQDSKTRIELKAGAITNEIQNKLSEDSSYEINTPNSNMSVRGTIYRVALTYDENGVSYTKLYVFDGAVATRLVDENGVVAEEEVMVPVGKEVTVFQDEETTDFYTEVVDIDYTELPSTVLEFLVEKMEEGEIELPITKEELKVIIEEKIEEEAKEETGPFTVTFECDGVVFGQQIVEKGECATEPKLMPAESGYWNFSFDQPITEDTVIEWKR